MAISLSGSVARCSLVGAGPGWSLRPGSLALLPTLLSAIRPAQNVARGALGSHRFAPASFHTYGAPPPRLSQSLHSRGPARRLYAGGGEGAL